MVLICGIVGSEVNEIIFAHVLDFMVGGLHLIGKLLIGYSGEHDLFDVKADSLIVCNVSQEHIDAR